MTQAQVFGPGNYRYVPGVFQYSGGVAAEPGFRIERVRFKNFVSLAEGFRLIEETLKAAGRPLSAFCACELRSPKPFDEAGFEAFNKEYVGTLEGEWQPGEYEIRTADGQVIVRGYQEIVCAARKAMCGDD